MKKLKKICVCGAGTMGSGIAQICAQSGFETILFDVNAITLQKAKLNIQKSLKTLADKKKISEEEIFNIFQRIYFTEQINECVADLIIEAIIENKEAKAELFNDLSNINNSETIFATNTSSISIAAITSATENVTTIIGMHFFNPAQIMKLVEVVQTKQANKNVIEQIIELAKQLGKTPVICKDSPGFIVNRVARPYYLEAMHLLELNLSNVKTIDKIMEATAFKMGPFKLMDLIGLDINFTVSNIVWEQLNKPERLMPSGLQQRKLTAGELGKKTNKGFYQY